jgi:hypothetical protein
VTLECNVVGDESGPFPMHPVDDVVRRVATVQIGDKPGSEPTSKFAPFAYTRLSRSCVVSGIEICLLVACQPCLPSLAVMYVEQ